MALDLPHWQNFETANSYTAINFMGFQETSIERRSNNF